jgi:uncharacterized protein
LSAARGTAIEILAADLEDSTQLAAVERRLREDPPVSLLVNNAGFGASGPFIDADIARQEQLIRLNVIALMRLTHAVLPGMRARGQGSVINVASELGLRPAPRMAAYGASKAFVVSFTRALDAEFHGSGVRFQVLCPGLTRTAFAEVAGLDAALRNTGWDPAFVVDWSYRDFIDGRLVSVPGTHRNRVVRVAHRFVRKVLAPFKSRD